MTVFAQIQVCHLVKATRTNLAVWVDFCATVLTVHIWRFGNWLGLDYVGNKLFDRGFGIRLFGCGWFFSSGLCTGRFCASWLCRGGLFGRRFFWRSCRSCNDYRFLLGLVVGVYFFFHDFHRLGCAFFRRVGSSNKLCCGLNLILLNQGKVF